MKDHLCTDELIILPYLKPPRRGQVWLENCHAKRIMAYSDGLQHCRWDVCQRHGPGLGQACHGPDTEALGCFRGKHYNAIAVHNCLEADAQDMIVS